MDDADDRTGSGRTDGGRGGGDPSTGGDGDSDGGAAPEDGDGDRAPTAAEVACFEAGVKFGSLYHQFAGTPVSPDSVDSLAAAMESAIENQPHCRSVDVQVRREALRAACEDHGYAEFTGRFAEVTVDVEREGVAVRAGMAMADGYPLMDVESVSSDGAASADEG